MWWSTARLRARRLDAAGTVLVYRAGARAGMDGAATCATDAAVVGLEHRARWRARSCWRVDWRAVGTVSAGTVRMGLVSAFVRATATLAVGARRV